jgi:hypothetical protein
MQLSPISHDASPSVPANISSFNTVIRTWCIYIYISKIYIILIMNLDRHLAWSVLELDHRKKLKSIVNRRVPIMKAYTLKVPFFHKFLGETRKLFRNSKKSFCHMHGPFVQLAPTSVWPLVNAASDATGSTRRFQGHDLPPCLSAIRSRRLVLLEPRSMDWWVRVRVHGTISQQREAACPWPVKKTTRRSQSRHGRAQGQPAS